MFLLPIDIESGIVNLRLKFCGNFFHPEINGVIKLESVILRGEQIPFVMESSNLLLNAIGNRLTLGGRINTSHGTLYISGNIYWNNIWSVYSYIRIVGDSVRFALSSTIKMDLSTIVFFEFTLRELLIRGKLEIPWADIKLEEYLRNIDISSDEVIAANVDDLSYF